MDMGKTAGDNSTIITAVYKKLVRRQLFSAAVSVGIHCKRRQNSLTRPQNWLKLLNLLNPGLSHRRADSGVKEFVLTRFLKTAVTDCC